MKAQKTDRTERMGVGIATTAFESLGFAFREQLESDYGIDAHAELIESEQPTGRLLGIQLKSGSSYFSEAAPDGSGYIFRTDKEHVDYWLNHALPVLICLCDIDTGTIYWQVISSETAISTGRMHKFIVPLNQIINSSSIIALHHLLTPIVATDRYTIFKKDDTSHGTAKRYSFEVVLNGSATKAEIAAIVRQITNEGQKSRYYRSPLGKSRWGDSDAHVVWTFIYPSAEDHTRHNHICRSMWICDSLPTGSRPIGFDGENVGDNIIVDWSTHYNLLGEHVSTNTLSKEDYLDRALPLIEELKTLSVTVDNGLRDLAENKVDEKAFLVSTETLRTRIDQIYAEISEMPFAPFECRDIDAKLECFIASLHNVWLFYSEDGRTKWNSENRLQLSLLQVSDARQTLEHLEYELSKAM